jgi:hypothetical protein
MAPRLYCPLDPRASSAPQRVVISTEAAHALVSSAMEKSASLFRPLEPLPISPPREHPPATRCLNHHAPTQVQSHRRARLRLFFADGVVCLCPGTCPARPIIQLFDTHRIVMFGEIHECRQHYDLLRQLVAAPGFAERVNDIVVEFGNARYQSIVDSSIAGGNVSLEQVQNAWRNTVGALGPVSPVYGEFSWSLTTTISVIETECGKW